MDRLKAAVEAQNTTKKTVWLSASKVFEITEARRQQHTAKGSSNQRFFCKRKA